MKKGGDDLADKGFHNVCEFSKGEKKLSKRENKINGLFKKPNLLPFKSDWIYH